MMRVRAKFTVVEIKRSKGWGTIDEIQTIVLMLSSDSEENKAFYAASPAARIELGTVNAEAARMFDLGCEYYVDFTLAAQTQASAGDPKVKRYRLNLTNRMKAVG